MRKSRALVFTASAVLCTGLRNHVRLGLGVRDLEDTSDTCRLFTDGFADFPGLNYWITC